MKIAVISGAFLSLLAMGGLDSHAFAKAAGPCPSQNRLQLSVQDLSRRLQPLIQSIPAQVKITYEKMQQPVTGYVRFAPENVAELHIVGEDCDNQLGLDDLAVLFCHELGHMAGGAPYMFFAGLKHDLKMSAEGQADFFAASSCLPQLWKEDNNSIYLPEIISNPQLSIICPESLEINDRGLCIRIAMASLRFVSYQHQVALVADEQSFPPKHPGPEPKLEAKDLSVVAKTLTREYPKYQCRLDTFIAGLHCPSSQAPGNYSTNPLAPVSCAASAQMAARPACWFKQD